MGIPPRSWAHSTYIHSTYIPIYPSGGSYVCKIIVSRAKCNPEVFNQFFASLWADEASTGAEPGASGESKVRSGAEMVLRW